MKIREIRLQPFRNFADMHLRFEVERTLIVGGNGRGKSNILEAISYLSIGKSVRGAKDQQAIPHEGQYFDINAQCHDGRRDRSLRIFFGTREGKRVYCDDSPLTRVSDIIGIFKTVHFSPEDVSLVLRFPAQRRRLLDILLSQSSVQYMHDLQRYQRVLSQRNQFLRETQRSGGPIDAAQFSAWDAPLAQLGAHLRLQRLNAIAQLGGPFEHYCERLAQRERAALQYSGTHLRENPADEKALEEELAEELKRKREAEIQQGYTMSGPHRDQLVFKLDGKPSDQYASEGQMKTLLIAWKLAEAHYLKSQSEQQPVLLLDDVLSELDPARVEQLLGVIDEFDQILLTTPQEPHEAFRECFGEIRLEN